MYFGDRHWDKPLSLKGCLDIPERLQPFVSDYTINLFEISWLEEEQVELFTSDFKIVFEPGPAVSKYCRAWFNKYIIVILQESTTGRSTRRPARSTLPYSL